ncbi:hypothetical protein ABT369_39160 [Dactylosporangium sp. NPDC000244]|uniref:hypothetical protein n=1 Tax=Dactylosporangium sp. NPDC000244 TaxID=3154365 RepID=UPI00331EED1C
MQKLAFIKELLAARPGIGHTLAGNWMRLAEALETTGITLTAADAAKWAALNYWPQEAGPLILDGITPEQADELEEHAAEQVGGHEALAAMRMAELHAGGVLDPDDVAVVRDPFDGWEIIVPRDELDR